MSFTINRTQTLEILDCISCGVPIALTSLHLGNMRTNKGTFYCPNGHPQGWYESEADRLRKQLHAAELEKTRLTNERAAAKASESSALMLAQEAAAAQANAEGETKRLKRRAAAGLCPCCNRTFVKLARHMKTKHPERASS